MPKCNINGKEIEVPEGTSVIEAFKAANEDIAHYCYHPGLSVAGCCRLCMVDIEGSPRPQIACNTKVSEGMVATNQSESIKETVKWGLDFHLINHPLDCPICDQAGECELQNQYMKFGGGYDSEMAERKVKKKKVVDLGKEVVLDSERCVLCSRCVRFTDEVTETHELGIFNRGDNSEIGTFKGKPLDNDYSVNTVDICPVGALTSKDFRFHQRVWYLKNKKTICTGCSTGCNVKAYYNEEGYFRYKPVFAEDVNGYWMCDEGRKVYKSTNKENRLWDYKLENGQVNPKEDTFLKLKTQLKSGSVGLVLTGQQTNEEYESIISYFKNELNCSSFFHWNSTEGKEAEFDGILMRGDKNPNTKGLEAAFKALGIQASKDLTGTNQVDNLVVVSPENLTHVTDLNEKVELFSKAKHLIWMGAALIGNLDSKANFQIPIRTYLEKSGSFSNFSGKVQKVKIVKTVNNQALSLVDVVKQLENKDVNPEVGEAFPKVKTNFFVDDRGTL
jgi:NADH-quinone oxidoreductase subunit G